jgi:hypothetical protein
LALKLEVDRLNLKKKSNNFLWRILTKTSRKKLKRPNFQPKRHPKLETPNIGPNISTKIYSEISGPKILNNKI